jgi:hypothetical protein
LNRSPPLCNGPQNNYYQPLYALMDLNPLVSDFEYRASNGQSGRDMGLSAGHFSEYLKSTKLKNGFAMTVLEFTTMNGQTQDTADGALGGGVIRGRVQVRNCDDVIGQVNRALRLAWSCLVDRRGSSLRCREHPWRRCRRLRCQRI